MPHFAPDVDDVRAASINRYMSMVGFLDDAVGEIVAALEARELWNNTLFVMSSDNGGPVYFNGTSGANNYPLRGGKTSNFEGGIRVPAFVASENDTAVLQHIEPTLLTMHRVALHVG